MCSGSYFDGFSVLIANPNWCAPIGKEQGNGTNKNFNSYYSVKPPTNGGAEIEF